MAFQPCSMLWPKYRVQGKFKGWCHIAVKLHIMDVAGANMQWLFAGRTLHLN